MKESGTKEQEGKNLKESTKRKETKYFLRFRFLQTEIILKNFVIIDSCSC